MTARYLLWSILGPLEPGQDDFEELPVDEDGELLEPLEGEGEDE